MALNKLENKTLYDGKKGVRILLDADIIAHKFAYVHENKYYKAQDGHTERYKNQIVKYCEDNKLVKSNVTVHREPSPPGEVLADIDEFLITITDNCQTNDMTCFLTLDKVYRHNIGTIVRYKWKRSVLTKPAHLELVKDHFINKYDAKFQKGLEADDLIGMEVEPNTIIASTDKDFDTLACSRYNWDTLRLYQITKHTAMINFYQMVILGDAADCIPGIHGIGLKSKHVTCLPKIRLEKDIFMYILKLYKQYYRLYADQFLLEVCSLLYILRGDKFKLKTRPYWMEYYGLAEEDIYKKPLGMLLRGEFIHDIDKND